MKTYRRSFNGITFDSSLIYQTRPESQGDSEE